MRIIAERLTTAICHKGLSGYSNILPRIKFRVGGQESSPQSASCHIAIRYAQAEKPKRNNKMLMKPKFN